MTSLLPSGVQFRPEDLVTTEVDGKRVVHYFPPHVVFSAEFLKTLPDTAHRFGQIERQPLSDPPIMDDTVCIDAENGAGLYRLGEAREDGSREGVLDGLRPGLVRGRVLRESALNAALQSALDNAMAERDDEAVMGMYKEFSARLVDDEGWSG